MIVLIVSCLVFMRLIVCFGGDKLGGKLLDVDKFHVLITD